MMLRGHICSLRAVEPQDLELLCRWENDPSLWTVSGTIEPFSHYSIEQFIQAEPLALLEEYARTVLRLRQLWCNVLADNVPSLTLFERAGFRRVGVKKEWIRTPEGYKDEVLLQKLL